MFINENLISWLSRESMVFLLVIELPGCRTQAITYDELLSRTKEAIELYLYENNAS